MKIKRLFAAILTALMVVSAFSFTANAQETQTVTNPVATVQTAKANHATYRAESALTKTKLYDAVSDKIYYRFTPVTSAGSATTKLDAYELPTINATNGVVYMAIELRSNYPVQPWVKLYHTVGTDGTAGAANNSECVAAVAAQGKETWERVVIKIENSKLASFTQNHFYLFSKSWSTAATTPADAYIDIAAFGYFADEYSAKNYNFGTAIAADGKVSFSVDGEVLDEVPTADPEVDGKIFIGWNADANATIGEAITAFSTVPDEDTTYHAILTGPIQDEKAVYLSNSGDDTNSGRHSKTPVKTLAKANEIISSVEGINKLVIVGTFTTTNTTDYNIGVAGKTITVTGYDATAIFDYDARKGGSDDDLFFDGPVIFENIIIIEGSGDGRMRTFGNTVTFGNGVTATSGIDIAPNGGSSSLITVNSGTFQRMYAGGFSDGNSFTGTSEIIINGGSVDQLGFGWGYNSCQNFSGTYKAEINGGSVNVITLDSGKPAIGTSAASYGHQSTNAYRGLRYYTLNDGKVDTIVTTSKATYGNNDANTATYRTGVTVYEINKADVVTGSIIPGRSDDDDATRVVIYNNESYVEGQVTDAKAIVIKSIGAEVHADVTVASDYTATLDGFTYESADDIYDAIRITANGTSNIYKFDDLDGEISLDKLTKGAVNTLEFVNSNEAEHIKAYRDAGYEIIYVAGKDLRSSVAANTAAGKKVVFALKDDLNLSGSYSLDNNGGTFVITSAGGNINLGTSSITLGSDKDADITFDHIALSKTSGERGINAVGNNLTLTETVTVSSGKDYIFYINAAGDGGDPAKPSKGNTITIETPSKVSVRGAGYSGNYTNGNVNFVFGKNAQAYLTAAGKVGNDNQPDTKGNMTVTVKDNAKLLEFALAEGKSFLTGNLDVTIKDNATVDVFNIANAVTGNATINIQSGMVGNITITDGKVAGRSSVIVDTDNATVGTITGAKYAIKFNGNLGKATPSADYATIALTPAATAKYVRVTNGDTVKEYNVAGEEVDLLADLSALALAEGATTVEFLADGTEAPKTADYTIEIYTMGTDGVYGEAVTETKTANVGEEVLYHAEEKTGFTISTGSTLSGTVTADGLLTLAVYYDRNQYKLYTKADAEAEAVEAGTYYYEEALTAPEAPVKDGYTFKGWAIDGTTEIIDTFAFTTSTTLVAVFEKNVELIDVKWIVDGEEVKAENVEAGTAVTAPTSPVKDGFTFKGWAIEGTTEIIDTFTFTTSTTLVAVFEEIPAEPEEKAIYKTYGVYDEEAGTYTVELKISGVKAHMGSFGFVLPGLVSVTAAEGITLFAEEEAAGAVVSPIFAKGEDFYANTWAIEAAPGYIDATQEEVLIATFVLEADAFFSEKFEEYVVEFANAKYYLGGHYLVAPKSDALDTDKIAVIYESHTDSIKEIEVPELEYKTYGTYNPVDGSYTIEVKFIGGKINAGAFGIEFDSDYMTYDPEADGAFVLADGIANYLGLALENTADGIAFVWDGSADTENGFVDATDAEVLIATIKTTMTEDQRAAYEAADAPAFALLDISGVEDSDKYFDGTDYLVSVYADNLAIDRVPASYTEHADEAVEITTADVTVKVTFADKAGATSVNLGYITVNGREPVVIDAEGNEEATVEYVINGANVGETLTIKVEKNGYLTAEAEVKVSAAGNTVVITTVAGDIKESTEAICGNGEIELSDFIRVVRAFDESATDAYKTTVDLDENGAVNVTDLGIVKANFSKTAADVTVEVK